MTVISEHPGYSYEQEERSAVNTRSSSQQWNLSEPIRIECLRLPLKNNFLEWVYNCCNFRRKDKLLGTPRSRIQYFDINIFVL